MQIGYGFFFKNNEDINRFIDATSLAQINLQQNEFEEDPDLELYEEIYGGTKLLFLEISEGVYLAIDKDDIEGKNAIYYLKLKISDSL